MRWSGNRSDQAQGCSRDSARCHRGSPYMVSYSPFIEIYIIIEPESMISRMSGYRQRDSDLSRCRQVAIGDATAIHAHVIAEILAGESVGVRDDEDLREGARDVPA